MHVGMVLGIQGPEVSSGSASLNACERRRHGSEQERQAKQVCTFGAPVLGKCRMPQQNSRLPEFRSQLRDALQALVQSGAGLRAIGARNAITELAPHIAACSPSCRTC